MAVEEVMIGYRNYRGEFSIRRIRPLRVEFKSTEWHPEAQWILDAIDLEKQAARGFAMRDISQWQPIKAARS